jgi:hypothetical protein
MHVMCVRTNLLGDNEKASSPRTPAWQKNRKATHIDYLRGN